MAAQICSIVINTIGSIFSKSSKSVPTSDFIPNWEEAFDDQEKLRPGEVNDLAGLKTLFKELANDNKPKVKTKKRRISK